MSGRYLVVTVLVGAIALFAWQSISNVFLPWHEATMTMLDERRSEPLARAVRDVAPENGVYYSGRGIFLAADMQPDMADQSAAMGDELATQFVLDLVVALLIAVLAWRLLQWAPWSALQTGTFFALAGLTVELLNQLADWNWYGFGLPYALVNVADNAIQWFLIGAIAAWFARKWGGGPAPAGARAESAGFTPRAAA